MENVPDALNEAMEMDKVRDKYEEERTRRLNPHRGAVPDLTGDLVRYLDDPYTEPIRRQPLDDEVDVVIVGAGFGGLTMAAHLRKQGMNRIRVIDRAGDVGGVWYWNRYPGAMCDVESYIYLPLLEEVGTVPTHRYSYAPEIYGHAQAIARHFDLYDLALFQTAVTGMDWNDLTASWAVRTDRGDRIKSRYVIVANGSFSMLKLPAIEGLENFKGHAFHTSRWDYEYTGGDNRGELEKLADKTVGVIGTGATAVQIIPPLGRSSKKLYLFQRTPSTVGVRDQRPTDADFIAELTREPGWRKKRRNNFTSMVSGRRESEDMVNDSWTQLYQSLLADPSYQDLSAEELAARREQVDLDRMEDIRSRIGSIVKDPKKAEGLKPYYRYLCKRPCFHDEYLDTFNLPNTELVDTKGLGIEKVTETGVVVDGKEYQLDCLVFATGFDSDSPFKDRVGFDVKGAGGQRLSEKWADGVSSLHGITTRGFPNFFMLPTNNMQSTGTVNLIHVIEENAEHVAFIIEELEKHGIAVFDVPEKAEQAWVDVIVEGSLRGNKFLEQCTPGRWNYEGALDARSPKNANYPGDVHVVFDILAEWRKQGIAENLELFQTAEEYRNRRSMAGQPG